jgi:hypothetical protein
VVQLPQCSACNNQVRWVVGSAPQSCIFSTSDGMVWELDEIRMCTRSRIAYVLLLTSRAFSSRLLVKMASASEAFEPGGMDGIIIAQPWISMV